MEIKMPIKFHGSYEVLVRSKDAVSRGRCQKLTIRELTEEEKNRLLQGGDRAVVATHQITFYDFGCKRLFDGKLMDNEEARVVFQVQDKEYELSPCKPAFR